MIKEYKDKEIIVSVSGGKDSTAMALNLLRQGYKTNEFRRVFADTGWETKETYEYLNYLESHIGKIERVSQKVEIVEEFRESIEEIEELLGFSSAMVREIYRQKFLPNGRVKYCTRRLKLEPLKDFFLSLDIEPVNLVGIRQEESARRSKFVEWQYNESFECFTHRPILDWKESDVIAIHSEFGILPNSLYLDGFSRVGCYPCIFSSKPEIKLLSEERVRVIEILERDIGATWFNKTNEDNSIRSVVDWSKTSFGGKQYSLFNLERPSCEKWGLCDIGM